MGTGGDTLKPDLVAPGVSILGATAPPGNEGEDFGFLSGYVGVGPPGGRARGVVVRGRGATDLVADEHQVGADDHRRRSGRRRRSKKVTDPFAQGAGRVVPDRMFAPGLVYPAGQRDWLGYLEGLGMDTGTDGPRRSTRATTTPRRSRSVGWWAGRP